MRLTKLSKFILAVGVITGGYQFYEHKIKVPDINDIELPNALHPSVAEGRDLLLERTAKIGIPINITQDFRTLNEQNALYAQGRTKEGQIVTQARGGESLHNFGLAIDFALIKKDGSVSWDMTYDGNGNGRSDWMEVVKIAKKLGFQWGGDWKGFKDYPHLEMRFGLSLRDLQRGEMPPEN